jgi:hypothetical protein
VIKFGVKYEGKTTFETISKGFEKYLSHQEIVRVTAFAINETVRKSLPVLNEALRKNYTVKLKGLKTVTKIKYAAATDTGLWATVSFRANPIEMGYFNYTVRRKGKRQNGVNVEIKKGRSVLMKHIWMQPNKYKSKSGLEKIHKTLVGRGSYIKGSGFVRGNTKETRMVGPSPFSMGLSKEVEKEMGTYIATSFPGRLQALLQQQVDKIGK